MNADRELLELAAKAAGIEIGRKIDNFDSRLRNVTGFPPEANLLAAPFWNPLTDDGDALRLAVNMMLQVLVFDDHVNVRFWYQGSVVVFIEEVSANGNNRLTAARRAIVRAAAELGKKMP